MTDSYLIWLGVFIVLPLIGLELKFSKLFWHYRKVFPFVIIGSLIVGIPLDFFAIKSHIWFYSRVGITNVWIIGIPLEEYLFIILVAVLGGMLGIIFWQNWGIE